MICRVAFAGIALLGLIIALFSTPVSGAEVVAQMTPTPTPKPPVFIPAWILGGGNFYSCCQDIDPGSTADQTLFAGVIDAGPSPEPSLGSNCPGPGPSGNISNCTPYYYVNLMWLVSCGQPGEAGTLATNAYGYLSTASNNDESGFLHQYTSSGQRLNPSAGTCGTPPPSSGNGFATNPDDSKWLNWLSSNAWTKSNFPAPYGILEDNLNIYGYPCDSSSEYGNAACNVVGNSGSHAPVDWETALGTFVNNIWSSSDCRTTCFYFVGNGLQPGGGSDTGSCDQGISMANPHCYVLGYGGVVDDMDAIANFCTAAYGTNSNTNTHGLEAEEVVFLKGTPAPSPSPTSGNTPIYADTQTIVYMINTMSQLVRYTSGGCENVNAIDIESSGGSFPGLYGYEPGTPTAGIPIREEATAFRFLVPDPVTLVPDRVVPLYYRISWTTNTGSDCCEVPYFFEETMVPQGPEWPVTAFHWNGTTQSVGDGCPSPNPGDTGGAVDLMAACLNDAASPTDGAAVFRQEYGHLYIAGQDYGPAAVLLNTASTASTLVSSAWFKPPGLSKYRYEIKLSGGELTSVFTGVISIPLPCTEPTYCSGNDSVSANTTAISGTLTIGPHSGLILLGSN